MRLGSIGFCLAAALLLAPLAFAADEETSDLSDTGASGVSTALPGEAGKHFEQGRAAIRRNDLAAAAAEFRAAAQAAPREAAPLLALAEVAARRQSFTEAETYVQQAMKIAPRAWQVYNTRAQVLALKKDYPGALAALDKALEVAPRVAVLHVRKGDIQATALHDRAAAMREYRAALAIDSGNAAAHYALGGQLMQSGQYAEAKAELSRATQLAPRNANGWAALGAVQAASGDREAAISSYDKAIDLSPSLPGAHVGRADVLASLGKLDAARTDYERALSANPRSAWVLVRMGELEQRAGRNAEAQKRYREALAVEPRQAIAANNLAFLLADDKRDLDEALRLAKVAVEVLPPSMENGWDTLAWVRRARGEYAEAAKILEPVAAHTKSPAVIYHLGVVYAEMGRKKDAVEAFDKALRLAPDYPAAKEARRKLAAD